MSRQFFLRCVFAVLVLKGIISTTHARYYMIPYLAGLSQIDFGGQNNVLMDGNRKSFPDALKEMDKSVQAELNKNNCNGFEPQKPNFKVEGRRISEIKCLDYIWLLKKDDGRNKTAIKCSGRVAVAGGKPSASGEYPHMGAIGWKGAEKGKWEFRCGGSLISERFVLTAAHCKTKNTPDIVRFGVVNLTDETAAVDRRVAKFINHGRYMPGYKNYDIAVIRLATKVLFIKNIHPACILDQRNVFEATITGWGAINERNSKAEINSNELLKAEVDILSNDICRKNYTWKRDPAYWKNYFEGEQFCATDMKGAGDVCGGDSGGPLQTELRVDSNQHIYNIIGVTSFNSQCGIRNFPSVYTRVNFHLDWIEEVVWGVKNEIKSREEKSNGNEVTPNQDFKTPTAENDIEISRIHHSGNGYWFSYKTPQGSKNNFINDIEIARIRQKNGLNFNTIEYIMNTR